MIASEISWFQLPKILFSSLQLKLKDGHKKDAKHKILLNLLCKVYIYLTLAFHSNDTLTIIVQKGKHFCEKYKRCFCYKPKNRILVCLTFDYKVVGNLAVTFVEI